MLGLAVAVACWLSFGGLGTRDVTRKAESRLAETSQEMLASGDWVVPTFGGKIRLEKPPLMYWVIAAVSAPFGRVTEVTAMFPIALSGLSLVLITMAWGSQLGGPRLGAFAGLALATMAGFYIKGHHIEAEMTLALFVSLAMWLWARRWSGVSRSPVELALALVSLALAFLTKGPPALVFPVVTFGSLAVLGWRKPDLRSRANLWIALACALSIASILPWALAVAALQPQAFGEWWEEIFRKRLSEDSSHGEPLLHYVTHLLPLLLPWLLLVPMAVRSLRPPRWSRDWAPVIAWAVMGFVAFSLFGGKRWYYLLPIFPPVALLAARGLDAWIEAPAGRLTRATTGTILVLSGVMALGAPGFALWSALTFDLPLIAPLLWSLLTFALVVVFMLLVRRAERARAAWALLLAVSALWVTYRLTVWPMENRDKSTEALARVIRETVGEEEPLWVFQTHATEMRFYLGRPVSELDSGAELLSQLRADAPRPLWLIIDSEDTEDLEGFAWSLAAEEIDGRPWEDFDFALVQVTGSVSRESSDHRG